MTTNRISFTTTSGASANGAVASPAGDGPAPGVVLLQEWWGVNAHIEDIAARLAAQGFLVLAPDLYKGVVTRDPTEAARLMNALNPVEALDMIGGALAHLRAHPRSNGKVGVMGFCMGGALTLASAANLPGLDAAVPFYGIPPAGSADYDKVTCPIMTHVATRDGWVKPELALAIKAQMDRRGHPMEVNVYEADHAFFNDTRPEVYSPEGAKLAWERSVAFLHQNLG